jgi:NFU1 iron-sulfur cluster scaffold homolog, mitochondrial
MIPTKVVTIYAESTPNPEAMKFVANRKLFEGSIEYPNRESALSSPFASQLFEFSCVQGVFLASNFVTITKTPDSRWEDVMSILREFIKSYLSSDDVIVDERTALAQSSLARPSLTPGENAAIEQQIREILDEYVRPAVEQDGGAIDFKSFEAGVVTVTLRGSCSGCPSSTITLKAGIENILKRMVPEVTEVVSEAL